MRNRITSLVLTSVAISFVACSDDAATPTGATLDDARPLAQAAKLPQITGGGITVNDNAGLGDAFSIGGFNARATGAGVNQAHAFFGAVQITVYPADGQFQVKNTLDDGNRRPVIKGHGEVVCIANFGPSNAVDGGGVESNDVWEIRVGFDSNGTTVYGSFLVQDNGREDYADENFAFARLLNPNCGLAEFFQLEPHQNGNIAVHD